MPHKMPELVAKTAENFTVKEMPADKGYLSNDNLEVVAVLGAVPFVPFKIKGPGKGTHGWHALLERFGDYYFAPWPGTTFGSRGSKSH